MMWQAQLEEYYGTNNPDDYSAAVVAATWLRLICDEKRKERWSEGTNDGGFIFKSDFRDEDACLKHFTSFVKDRLIN